MSKIMHDRNIKMIYTGIHATYSRGDYTTITGRQVLFLFWMCINAINLSRYYVLYQSYLLKPTQNLLKYLPISISISISGDISHLISADDFRLLWQYIADESRIFYFHELTFSFFLFFLGTPLSEFDVQWIPGEPNNRNNDERCLVMDASGSLADVDCTRDYYFICHKSGTQMSAHSCNPPGSGSHSGNCTNNYYYYYYK